MSSFPAEWTSTKLGKVAKEMFGGGTPSTKNPSFWQGNIPWLTSKSLGDAIYLTAGEKTISEEAVRKSATHIVPAGNLIFATRVGVGKVVVTKIDVAISQDGTGIVIDPTEVDPTFLAYQLRTDSVQRFVQQNKRGATIQGITRTSLQQVDVLIPPLPEQRRIAHVLTTVQTAIEQQARLIALTRELKSALMRKLFTEGLRGEKQKETEIGLVPESWAVTEVGKVCKSSVPGRNKPKEFSGDIPWVTTPDIKGKTYITANATKNLVSREHLKEIGGKTVPRDSVIMTCVGEFGIVAIAQTEIVINQQLHAFICPEYLDPFFLCNTLRLRKSYMEQIAHITTLPYLNKSKCESVLIAYPNIEEQLKISEMIKVVEQKIELHIQKKQALEELFRTLLHQLMTGQIRLNEANVTGL